MNDEPDELERELRRLFTDERLTIPPAQGAPLAVMAGARRIRRRREFAVLGGGSLAAAAVLVAGFLLTSPMRQDGDQPLAAPPATETLTRGTTLTVAPPAEAAPDDDRRPRPPESTRTDAAAKKEAPLTEALESAQRVTPTPTEANTGENLDRPLIASAVIGPSGYGELALRMTFAEVKEKGLLADPDAPPPPSGGCAGYALAEGDHSVREIHISDAIGVAVITASGAATPEGIAVGSSEEELTDAYPGEKLTRDDRGYRAAAAEGAHYRFVVSDGVVEQLHLVLDDQDCGDF